MALFARANLIGGTTELSAIPTKASALVVNKPYALRRIMRTYHEIYKDSVRVILEDVTTKTLYSVYLPRRSTQMSDADLKAMNDLCLNCSENPIIFLVLAHRRNTIEYKFFPPNPAPADVFAGEGTSSVTE